MIFTILRLEYLIKRSSYMNSLVIIGYLILMITINLKKIDRDFEIIQNRTSKLKGVFYSKRLKNGSQEPPVSGN